MFKSKLLFAVCCNLVFNISSAHTSPLTSHTHTHTQRTHNDVSTELKPIANSNLTGSYQIAATAFLPEWESTFSGFSNSNIDFGNDDISNQRIHTKCLINGYTRTSCDEGYTPQNFCPESDSYFRSCKSLAELCREQGFTASCNPGYIKNPENICTYDSNYGECIIDPCTGYDYTLGEATADGYTMVAECLSGTEYKYQRSESACPGFAYDSSNCGHSIKCQILAGSTCRSGEIIKYSECKPCLVESCIFPKLNLDTYYCDSALRCLIP